MSKNYSQIKAMLAVTKASLIASFRSPQSLLFALFFPVVLIVIFGLIGSNAAPGVDIAFEQHTDTTNMIYQAIRQNPMFHVAERNKRNVEDELSKGRIAAILDIQPSNHTAHTPYIIHVRTSSAAAAGRKVLYDALRATIQNLDQHLFPNEPTVAAIQETVIRGRTYRSIDFFLPGMIGFSLIGSAVFGVAFLFYSLRETLVLKRMYATPIKRQYIILGESLSKVIFQLMTVVILIGFGYFFYHFYLAQGFLTFLDMLVMSALGLLVFMGMGFLISSLSRNQGAIPVYANLFMFPQFFLSGTFFPKSSLPDFLQPLINALPLTAFNDSMRNLAFEGSSLASCWPQALVLGIWGILIYAITAKTFRWE
jgi:ABC-2 type transport system permease protein